ncbi:lipoprotein required for motility, partial [Campylobacter jejuni]
MKKIYFMLAIAGIFAGCVPRANSATKNSSANSTAPSQDVIVPKVDKDDVRDIISEEKMLAPDASETELSFTDVGEGIARLTTVSTAQAIALETQAAIPDAYSYISLIPKG